MGEERRRRLLRFPLVLCSVLSLYGTGATAEAQTLGFIRGDSNGDGDVDIADAVSTLMHLFLGHELSCLDAADVDANGELEITDPIALLGHTFLGDPPPAAPYPGCGAAAPGAVSLGCAEPYCQYEPTQPELVWMAARDGCRQCEACLGIEEIVAILEARGIEIHDARYKSDRNVPACCGCDSSYSYYVLVSAQDVPRLAEVVPYAWLAREP